MSTLWRESPSGCLQAGNLFEEEIGQFSTSVVLSEFFQVEPMCEILIRVNSSRMPTVTEWRTAMTIKGIPMANAFIASNPGIPKGITDFKYYADYQEARQLLIKDVQGKLVLSDEDRIKYQNIVTTYEAAPLTTPELDYARLIHKGNVSLVSQWHYYKHLVEVDAVKSDAEKETELLEKDQRGCYKRGDPVVVMPDGHEWGAKEGLPHFVIVKIPGLAVTTAEKYIQHELSDTPNPDGTYPTIRRRLFHILVDDIPAVIKNQLLTTGSVTVTLTQIRNYIQNKKTLATE